MDKTNTMISNWCYLIRKQNILIVNISEKKLDSTTGGKDMNRMQAETKKDSSTSCINNYSIRAIKNKR